MAKKANVRIIGFILFLCTLVPSLYGVQNDENDSTSAYMAICLATIGGCAIFYAEDQDARKDKYVLFIVIGFVFQALGLFAVYYSFETWHAEGDDRRLRGRRLHSLQ